MLVLEHDLTMDALLEDGPSDLRCCYHSNIYQSLLVINHRSSDLLLYTCHCGIVSQVLVSLCVCVCVSVCPPMHGIVYEYGTRTILQIPNTINYSVHWILIFIGRVCTLCVCPHCLRCQTSHVHYIVSSSIPQKILI